MSDKTYSPKAGDIEHQWHVVDATDQVLGRLASQIALVLRGKHTPTYAPHMDMGDHMVVVNAEKIKVTGKKLEDKIYYRHTGYIGNLKSINLGKLMDTHPERALQYAVKGMLPKNPLGRAMYRKLHVYAGPEHPHQAQQPTQLEL